MESSLYLYALAAADARWPVHARGINDEPLERVAVGALAAIVSPLASPRVRPERANLLRQHALLAELMREHAVLPFAFGTVAAGRHQLVALLESQADRFSAALARIGNCVEMSLTGSFADGDASDLAATLAAKDPGLRRHREQVFGSAMTASRNDMIALGMRVEQVLERTRISLAETVMTVVGPVCTEWKSLDCHGTTQMFNIACLVSRERDTAFEQACEQAARFLDDDMTLRMGGPWAPHSFVTLPVHVEQGDVDPR